MGTNDGSLKSKTLSGMAWKFGERMLTQVVSFVVSIVLARLLLPEAFGMLAIVGVFMTLCDKMVVSGFATGLIQKKDADNLDFSTIFFFSLAVSAVLYGILFLTAPLIADFYSKFDRETLIAVLRVMGLRMFVTAINSVQHAYVSRTMQFRRFFWSSLGGTLLSAVVGIGMAVAGCGVWALIAQYMTDAVVDTAVLWFTVKWRPQFRFSTERFRSLYSYGWKLFAASMIRTLYNDLRSLVIGKKYTPEDLAFYNKGQSFPQLIDSNVSSPIDAVLFPAIAKKQSEPQELLQMLRRAIRVSCYVLMPLLAGLAAVAHPLVLLLLGEKWEPCVIYMQVLSFSFLLAPMELENLQAIKAIGRSDIALRLEIVKKTVGILLMVAAIPLGVFWIAVSMLIGAVFSAVANAWPNRRLLGYSFGKQVQDILPALLLSGTMFVTVLLLGNLLEALGVWEIAVLIAQVLTGAAVYVGLSVLFRVDSFTYVLQIIRQKKGK